MQTVNTRSDYINIKREEKPITCRADTIQFQKTKQNI